MTKTTVPGSVWEDLAFLDQCEKKRVRHKRRIGRVTYDCQYAKVNGERVRCKKERILDKLSSDGSMYLLAVLKGRTSYACLKCDKYSEG